MNLFMNSPNDNNAAADQGETRKIFIQVVIFLLAVIAAVSCFQRHFEMKPNPPSLANDEESIYGQPHNDEVGNKGLFASNPVVEWQEDNLAIEFHIRRSNMSGLSFKLSFGPIVRFWDADNIQLSEEEFTVACPKDFRLGQSGQFSVQLKVKCPPNAKECAVEYFPGLMTRRVTVPVR